MGLFDSYFLQEPIKCPCGEEHTDFQSKDLDCMLDNFTINKEGILEVEDYKLEIAPSVKIGKFDIPQTKKEILGYRILNLTDTLNLYTSCKKGLHWIDLTLTYIDGKLINKKLNISEIE